MSHAEPILGESFLFHKSRLVWHSMNQEFHSEVDIALLEYNLSLSYEERLAQHASALDLVLELQSAGRILRSKEHENGSQQAPAHVARE
jgi:hypothetical protein